MDITKELKAINEKLEKLGKKNDYYLKAEHEEIEQLKKILENVFIK